MFSANTLAGISVALLGVAAILVAGAWLAKRWPNLSTRGRWVLGGGLAVLELAFWIGVYAWFIEPERLVVREVTIVSEHWQGAPLRIAAIGDTHVGGPHVSAARMGRVVARINELRPDLVVLLGDYVNGHAPQAERSPREQQEIAGGVATFAALAPRYGVVGVIGNHDSWYNRATITDALQNAGVAALWNRHIVIDRPGGDIVVAGLEDDWTGHPDLAAALDGAPDDAPNTILLSHSPDPFADIPQPTHDPAVVWERYPALMLGAHGHCGQVTIPFVGRPVLPLRNKHYGCHLVQEGEKTIYATAGIGTSILPVRFLNPPEIVLITLRSDAPSQTRWIE